MKTYFGFVFKVFVDEFKESISSCREKKREKIVILTVWNNRHQHRSLVPSLPDAE